MTLMRLAPLSELSAIRTEMNRLFNTFFETPPAGDGDRQKKIEA